MSQPIVRIAFFGLTLITMAGCASAPEREASPAPAARAETGRASNGEIASVGVTRTNGSVEVAPAAAPAPATKTARSAHADAMMEQYAEESRLRRQERRALSDHYFRVGKAFYDELDYLQAKKNFELAVKADPDNRIAERHLEAAQALLGERESTVREVADALAEKEVAGRDQKRIELRRLFDQGMTYMDAREYDKAIKQFERVLEEIRWYPHALDDPNVAQRAQAQLDRARDRR